MDKGRVLLKYKPNKLGMSDLEQEASYKTGAQLLEKCQGASQSNGGRNQQFHKQDSDLLSNISLWAFSGVEGELSSSALSLLGALTETSCFLWPPVFLNFVRTRYVCGFSSCSDSSWNWSTVPAGNWVHGVTTHMSCLSLMYGEEMAANHFCGGSCHFHRSDLQEVSLLKRKRWLLCDTVHLSVLFEAIRNSSQRSCLHLMLPQKSWVTLNPNSPCFSTVYCMLVWWLGKSWSTTKAETGSFLKIYSCCMAAFITIR